MSDPASTGQSVSAPAAQTDGGTPGDIGGGSGKTKGNNGWGNGDQNAPGGSLAHNNAENGSSGKSAPGNSGGLVVNAQGRMVGIPTNVQAEDRTLGRLGGILSVSAIRGALDNTQDSLPLPLSAPVPVKFSSEGGQPTPSSAETSWSRSLPWTNGSVPGDTPPA